VVVPVAGHCTAAYDAARFNPEPVGNVVFDRALSELHAIRRLNVLIYFDTPPQAA
jgi:hypothetical protein